MKKFIICFTSALIMSFTSVFASPISVNSVPVEVNISDKIKILDDTTYVPINGIFDICGFKITIDTTGSSPAVLHFKTNTKNGVYYLNENKITLNGKLINSSVYSKTIDNEIYIPLRDVAEALGAEVTWDSTTKSVDVKYSEPSLEYSNDPSKKGFELDELDALTQFYKDSNSIYELTKNDRKLTSEESKKLTDLYTHLSGITFPESIKDVGKNINDVANFWLKMNNDSYSDAEKLSFKESYENSSRLIISELDKLYNLVGVNPYEEFKTKYINPLQTPSEYININNEQ